MSAKARAKRGPFASAQNHWPARSISKTKIGGWQYTTSQATQNRTTPGTKEPDLDDIQQME